MKRFCLIFSALVSVAVALADEPIRLGVIAPLSGDFASYGEHIRKGASLAAIELNNAGLDISLYFEDACLPNETLSALKQLIDIRRIHGIAANYCIIGMTTAQPILAKKELLAFQASVSPQDLMQTGGNVFSTYPKILQEAKLTAQYAYHTLHARSAAILYLTTQWGEEYKTSFQEEFEKLGGNISKVASNPIGINDFRTELTSIKASHPDVIFIAHVGLTLGVALKQTRQLGFGGTILTVDEAADQSVTKVAGNAVYDTHFFSFDETIVPTKISSFDRAYLNRYHQPAGMLARQSYDSTKILAKTLAKCHLQYSCSREYLTNNSHATTSGPIRFEADGSTSRKFTLKHLSDFHN